MRESVCVCRYTRAREIISTHAHSMLLINRERENKNRATISSVSIFSRAKSRAWKRPLSFIHVRFFSSPKSARFRLHGKRAFGRVIITPCLALSGMCSHTMKRLNSFVMCDHNVVPPCIMCPLDIVSMPVALLRLNDFTAKVTSSSVISSSNISL